MLWVLVVLLAGVIGAVVYYFGVMKPYPLKRMRPPIVPPGTQPPSYQQTAPPQQPQQAQAQPPQPQPPSLHGRPGA
jgi:hypothetical protein